MYNLLIGFTHEEHKSKSTHEVPKNRTLQQFSTTEGIRQYAASASVNKQEEVGIKRFLNLPTLLMPEIQTKGVPQVAYVGHIADINETKDSYSVTFAPNSMVNPIHTSEIEGMTTALGISDWELDQTHWAVKDVDLYRILGQGISPRSASKVFRLPTEKPFEPDLVAVMMPFSSDFAPVYKSLQKGIEAAGMRCNRADDIWVENHILDDILSLIWRARVIIADLSGRNPNVFYETGIAHALNRDTILVSQSLQDISFDLQSIRVLPYLKNDQGLGELSEKITERLNTITASNRSGQ